MPRMLSFMPECGTSTIGNNAWLALRMRVNMSEMGSFTKWWVKALEPSRIEAGAYYQLALVTPGINPLSADSRKVSREQPNLRK